MYLFVVIVVFQCFQLANTACRMTTTTTTTTTPPPPACSLCGTLPLTPGPYHPTTIDSPGIVTQTTNSTGCKQYSVRCYAVGTKYVVIGANQQFIQISAASPGEKTATLSCNGKGQIEGRIYPNNTPLIVTSVYCSTQRYNM